MGDGTANNEPNNIQNILNAYINRKTEKYFTALVKKEDIENADYNLSVSTYVESGVRRITLAEKLRKIPLSFFGKKDLSDLTSTIMADCAQMETASSHFIPELVGACISTAIVAVGMFFFNWRMALAALWVLPVSFLIVGCSGKVQKSLNQKQMELKMACADGIQECLESARDLHAYNADTSATQKKNITMRSTNPSMLTTQTKLSSNHLSRAVNSPAVSLPEKLFRLLRSFQRTDSSTMRTNIRQAALPRSVLLYLSMKRRKN